MQPSIPVALHSLLFRTTHLLYLPAQSFLAEAVPEREEDYPCISYSSTICQSFGLYAVQEWWDIQLR
jgi:hypothetical protein